MKHRERIRAAKKTSEPRAGFKFKTKPQNTYLLLGALVLIFLALAYSFSRGKSSTTENTTEATEAAVPDNATTADSTENALTTVIDTSFKEKQMRFPRVRDAFRAKRANLLKLLEEKDILTFSIDIYLRVFKQEQLVEVWVRDRADAQFQLLITYPFCATSGTLGPKTTKGDEQIPEGFYIIDRFNPSSSFHLSLGINYPNRADQLRSEEGADLGGDIFLLGGCTSVGSIPLGDDKIKELYVLAVEAKSDGQPKIPITIFPAKMDKESYEKLQEQAKDNELLQTLWASLKQGYDYFDLCHDLPRVTITPKGKYIVQEKCK
jgi:murein L,D-transpeptidase YafK